MCRLCNKFNIERDLGSILSNVRKIMIKNISKIQFQFSKSNHFFAVNLPKKITKLKKFRMIMALQKLNHQMLLNPKSIM